jgi:hypothetical protein
LIKHFIDAGAKVRVRVRVREIWSRNLFHILSLVYHIYNINFKFFVSLHGDKTYNSFVCGNKQ